MRRLATADGIATSLTLFGLMALLLPFIAAIWLDSLAVDVFAFMLMALGGAIGNNRSLRAAMIAQFMSIVYCVAYAGALFMLIFFGNGITTPGNRAVSPLFALTAIPFVFLFLGWGVLNIVSLNPFVRGRKIPDKVLADTSQ
jgi:hypothetical protein